MEVETLTGSSSSSSSSSSDSSNSSAESEDQSDIEENTDNNVLRHKPKAEKNVTDPASQAKTYHQRYNLLMERINAINQDNEHLVSRILEVRGLCKVGLRHRAAIMKRLDGYGDNYRNIPVTFSLDKESASAQSSHLSAVSLPDLGTDMSLVHSSLSIPSHIPKKMRKKLKRERAPSIEGSDTDSSRKPSGQPRDSEMPKRPHNAFFYYSQDKRPKMQKEFPNLSKKDIAGILSARWAQISEEEKMPFKRYEEQRRVEYRAALQKYKERIATV